ncbi:ty3-gypsy retrotransposon protein [Cucumis melo var. makuwa]|uniref:Ty3-gypsy retrotransposon protein n=1 Tax=Cucumis melo var. makuwa TaxID=1194695 RepID=A0A5D3BD08_CUCMM|nr:ty3-gypsy retrotransposon protein [Cucumis melo var. makuwa]TYJ96511.1 ty3-gypsy retrotransposon protein [Cucumis melo var. makuwa]
MSHPNIMSVMATDVDTSEDRMTKLEKKINMLMKAVEERDYEIVSLKKHIRFVILLNQYPRIVSMMKLTNTRQQKGESIIDYINRWRALSLDYKDQLTELSAVEMYTQSMHWELLYILQGTKPSTFEELVTCVHDMEFSIANRGAKDILV